MNNKIFLYMRCFYLWLEIKRVQFLIVANKILHPFFSFLTKEKEMFVARNDNKFIYSELDYANGITYQFGYVTGYLYIYRRFKKKPHSINEAIKTTHVPPCLNVPEIYVMSYRKAINDRYVAKHLKLVDAVCKRLFTSTENK